MTLEKLNNLDSKLLFSELFKCCGSTTWATKLVQEKPFSSLSDLIAKSDKIWSQSSKEDGLEAFTHHPKIGNISDLEKKFSSTKEWAKGEQSGMNVANRKVIEALAKGNADYEAKFGFIFIVCATGKTAEEMLALLNERIENDFEKEFAIAMNEQNKITKIRLEKLLSLKMSQITTHILDTSKGKPAKGVLICLEKQIDTNSWKEIGRGYTNDDGRLPGLVTENTFLEFGIYKLIFDTESYYKNTSVEGLYPFVSISFKVTENKHYHIPLLLNPFGYSTYRGS